MSHDLAVWVGNRPASNALAAEEFEARFEESERDNRSPGPAIKAFVSALTQEYPEGRDDGVWAVEPLLEDVGGDFLYLNMTRSRHLEAAIALASRLAKQHGLVAYDPQMEELI